MRSHLCTLAILASVLLVLLAISGPTVRCLTEDKPSESPNPSNPDDVDDDSGDYDNYEGDSDGEISAKQENPQPLPPMPYTPQQGPPQQPMPLPPRPYQTAPLPMPPPYQPGSPMVDNGYYQPLYDPSIQPAYVQQAPLQQQPNYSAPIYPQSFDLYQQVPAPTYQAASPPVYQGPPIPLVSNYSVPPPSYQPVPLPAPVSYSAAPVVIANYSSAPVQQTYSTIPTQQTYAAPQKSYAQAGGNYSQAAYAVARPVAGYAPAQLPPAQRYSLADLVPFIPMNGYRSNHWSLFYYRASPYRVCPKNVYLNPPSYKDIEIAFNYAKQQLANTRGISIQYLNSTSPQLGGSSWASRHQIFSFLNQQSARMDEDGLLVELISQYVSDRACLTKWDKQRYLPQLTKFISTSQFPGTHSCSNIYQSQQQWSGNKLNYCIQSKYRTFDGFCNNPYHPYWGKANVCHIRLLSPDYADGISAPRNSYNLRYPLPNPRLISNYIHTDIPIEGPYNLLKMQWGQFINHDITNTALSTYDGLVDCCKNPTIRGCWPIYVPPGDRFYSQLNVTCLSFIRSGVCPLCELGPRQQVNKNTAFLDLSHVYGNNLEQAIKLRTFVGGQLKTSLSKNGEQLLPVQSGGEQQCPGICFEAGDNRVNQHPGLTALHVLLLRNHNIHARNLAQRHPQWSDEILFQEARRLNIAEYQMITYGEYMPIVFGPILSAYYKLIPNRGPNSYTYFEPKADPTTWNEYSTAACRFGHSQITSTFGLYQTILGYSQHQNPKSSYRLKDWFMRPSFLYDGLMKPIMNGLLDAKSDTVDPWVTTDVRNHLYQSHKDLFGGDLAATNIWRGRDHGIPGYIYYLDYCFNFKVRSWKDLQLFIPYYTLNQLKKLYKVPENIDLFTGGLSERHFPGADIGPTFACINGIQYYHLKFGDRYYFEHANQAGSFTPQQLDEIKRTTLARLICRTAYLPAVPAYAFLQASIYNPLINCSQVGEIDYNKF